MPTAFIDPIKTIRENAERVLRIPSYIHELRPYQIDEMATYAKTIKRVLADRYGIEYSEDISTLELFQFGEPFPTMEDLEEMVFAVRVLDVIRPDKGKKQRPPKEVKELPERLADMVVDPNILPSLFAHIRHCEHTTRESTPCFSNYGYTGPKKRHVGPLMGLMDGLMEKRQIILPYSAIDAYNVYSTELGLPVSNCPADARDGTKCKEIHRATTLFFERKDA